MRRMLLGMCCVLGTMNAYAGNLGADYCHWHDGAYRLAATLRDDGVSSADARDRVWDAVADEKADAFIEASAAEGAANISDAAQAKAKVLDAIRELPVAHTSVDIVSDQVLHDVYARWAALSPGAVVSAGYNECERLRACQSAKDPDDCEAEVLR